MEISKVRRVRKPRKNNFLFIEYFISMEGLYQLFHMNEELIERARIFGKEIIDLTNSDGKERSIFFTLDDVTILTKIFLYQILILISKDNLSGKK